MRISDKNAALANEFRKAIQSQTEIVSDGEGVAMILLWSFLMDHAKIHQLDVSTLAREQMEAFIDYAHENIALVREH